MRNNIGIIIGREFRERVAKKSFIITTLLMPVLMLLFMVAPAAIIALSTPSEKHLAVVDESGIIFAPLKTETDKVDYLEVTDFKQPLDSAIASADYDGVLYIGPDVVENPRNATLYLHDASGLEIESLINSVLKETIEDQRLKAYNIENLSEIMAEVTVDTNVSTIRIDESGEEESTSSMMSMGVGMVMTFILYMFLLMYGQMVMTSIIEEKNNRVLELVVSSVKPVQLMMGKIIGVGLVAVVQVAIWGVLLCLMSGLLLPALIPDSLMAQMNAMNAGAMPDGLGGEDAEMLQALGMLTSVSYIATIFGYMLLFLVGGFLLYASIFAAIGSAVDNVQDASQLQTFAILPIMIALIFSVSIAADPNSQAAFWLSMIPLTSPMVMLARIPFGIPSWEIWVSAVVLYASFVGMAWVAAKIYRVGIFMYGKEPSIKDLARWARYK